MLSAASVIGILLLAAFAVGRGDGGRDVNPAEPGGQTAPPEPSPTAESTPPSGATAAANTPLRAIINGIEVGVTEDGPGWGCAKLAPYIDWKQETAGTPFEVNLAALPVGVKLVGEPRFGKCADGRLLWLDLTLDTGGGGQIYVSRSSSGRWWRQRAPSARWSAGEVAGRPAAILAPILPNLGEAGVFVLDAETDGSTRIISSSASLEFIRIVAEAIYKSTAPDPFDVPFTVCRITTGWELPSLDEMRKTAFTNPRFGDGVRPSPWHYFIYLSPFHYIGAPKAISGSIDPAVFSGVNHVTDNTRSEFFCPPPGQNPSYGDDEQRLWLANYRVRVMRRNGDGLDVTVRQAPGEFQVVAFANDDALRRSGATGKVGPTGFAPLRIFSEGGTLLYERFEFGGEVLYDAHGPVFFVLNAPGAPVAVTIPQRAGYILMEDRPGEPGAVRVTRANGISVTHPKVPHGLFGGRSIEFSLEPGDYQLSVDAPNAGGGSAFILRADVPLP